MLLRVTNSRPEHTMFTALVSNPQVRLSSLTNTQGSPHHRLAILASQNSGMHVLISLSSMHGGDDETSTPVFLYRFRRHRLG